MTKKRLDIVILKKLNKGKDSDVDYIDLAPLIKPYGFDYLENKCHELSHNEHIYYFLPKESYEKDRTGGQKIICKKYIYGKITTEGRNCLLEYKNKVSTRRIAVLAILIAICSSILTGLGLIPTD